MAKKKVQKNTAVKIKVKDIVMVATDKIIPHPKNPNIHSEDQIKMLANLIKHHGFDTTLVVSKRTGFLIKGEGRWKAAQLLGMSIVPVSYQDFDNDAKEYSAMVSDNEIARASRIDVDAVKIQMKAFKIDPLNFGFDDPTKLIDVKGHQRDPKGKNKELDTSEYGNDLEHTCPKCGFEFSGQEK